MIEFTQYLRPNGRKVLVGIDCSPEIQTLARQIIEKGYEFECEELRTGDVSLTITDPVEEQDVDIEIVRAHIRWNVLGAVNDAVERLVKRFAEKMNASSPST